MRFSFPSVKNSQAILDSAFAQSRQALPRLSKRIRKKERWAKELERYRVETAANGIVEEIQDILDAFPVLENLPSFYRELADAAMGLSETKQQLGRIKKSGLLVKRLRSRTVQDIFASKNTGHIRKLSRAFFGRASSMVKKVNKELVSLEAKRKEMQEWPNVRLDCFTIVLAGFPNVGKTTLLKKLTGSEPRIASFPFTTQGLKLGYWEEGFVQIQVMDTPGVLDRLDKDRNPIEKKALVAFAHFGQVLLFVVDVSLSSGFSLEQQLSLWRELQKRFPRQEHLVLLTKEDLSSPEQIAEARRFFPGLKLTSEMDEIKAALYREARDWLKKNPPRALNHHYS